MFEQSPGAFVRGLFSRTIHCTVHLTMLLCVINSWSTVFTDRQAFLDPLWPALCLVSRSGRQWSESPAQCADYQVNMPSTNLSGRPFSR